MKETPDRMQIPESCPYHTLFTPMTVKWWLTALSPSGYHTAGRFHAGRNREIYLTGKTMRGCRYLPLGRPKAESILTLRFCCARIKPRLQNRRILCFPFNLCGPGKCCNIKQLGSCKQHARQLTCQRNGADWRDFARTGTARSDERYHGKVLADGVDSNSEG